MNKLNGKSLQVVFFILSVALATVDNWAGCTREVLSINTNRCSWTGDEWCRDCSSYYGDRGYVGTTVECHNSWTGKPNCNKIVSRGDSPLSFFDGCPGNSQAPYIVTCTDECSKAEYECQRDGGIFNADSCTCKINYCKAADSTWLSTSIAACTGSNNYALVNTDSTCEHVGTCCPNDSIPNGNTCKWRCDSVLTQCNGRAGDLFGAVLPDTSVSGEDTTFSYQCFYNCAYSPNPDSTVYLVEGNTVLSGPNDSIQDGIKSETFNSVRTTTGGVYVYDYLSPAASEYIDSIAAMKCVEHLWRCVINNKYVYWYDNQEVPAGCTNIVRVK